VITVSALRELALEARSSLHAVRAELAESASGRVVVSGMLAEQLARELGAGAQPGAVVVGDDVRGAAVVVRVLAGEPSAEDDAIVRAADRAVVPVVLVQTWPQAERGAPYVLSPFVVECRTGEGFPMSEIVAQVTTAVENPPALAVRVPLLAEPAESSVVRSAAARAALLALAGVPGGRAGIALEQARMLARLRALHPPSQPDHPAVVVGAVASTLGVSYALRGAARAASRALPKRVVDPLIAAAGTFALAHALRVLNSRL
jgi:hypothetical protein